MLANPFVQSQKIWGFWAQVAEDNTARFARIAEQQKDVEERAAARTRDAIEETARLAKESIDYVTSLTTEWRKLTLDFAKQTAESETKA
jgi:hypothetical protein